MPECEIIQKQQEYIKELEQKLARLSGESSKKNWDSIKNQICGRCMELFDSDSVRAYKFQNALYSILGKILDVRTVLAIENDNADKAKDIANRIMDIAEEYINKK